MRATGMKSPTENESCSTCGRSEFRFGWPKWGSAAVVMMLAWSTCEPPNGYGVTNCSSLSGNALAALVSAKAAAAVVASEVIDRRVVMISLFATTFLRSPRHRRRLAFGNRQVPSLAAFNQLGGFLVPDVRRALRGARNRPRFEASSAWIFRPSYHRQHCALRRRICASAHQYPT